MKRALGLVAVFSIVVAACGSSSDVDVSDVWARTSAMAQDAGAVYMTIRGGDEPDSLISARVDSSVAAMAQLHESMMGDDNMMMMEAVPTIPVPADGEVMLEPGGYHIMLMQLTEPLVAGSEITVTLTFESGTQMTVTAEVRDE